MEWGSTGRVVAAALGHTSFAMTTQRHYVKEGTVERAAQRRVGLMLEQTPERDDEVDADDHPEPVAVPEVAPERATSRPTGVPGDRGAGSVAAEKPAATNRSACNGSGYSLHVWAQTCSARPT